MQLRDELIRKRKLVTDIENEHLALRGHDARVNHRTLKDQDAPHTPERHLGPTRVRNMSAEERAEYVALRKGKSGTPKH